MVTQSPPVSPSVVAATFAIQKPSVTAATFAEAVDKACGRASVIDAFQRSGDGQGSGRERTVSDRFVS